MYIIPRKYYAYAHRNLYDDDAKLSNFSRSYWLLACRLSVWLSVRLPVCNAIHCVALRVGV